MIYRRTGRFKSAYVQLPKEIQGKAIKYNTHVAKIARCFV